MTGGGRAFLSRNMQAQGRVEAVYTLEAAFVMLISLSALLALTGLTFYVHDRQVLESEMSRLVRRAAEEAWTEEALRKEFDRGNNCTLFFLKVEEVRTSAEAGKTLEAKIEFPLLPFLPTWFEEEETAGWVRRSASAYLPQEFIRKTEAWKGVLE